MSIGVSERIIKSATRNNDGGARQESNPQSLHHLVSNVLGNPKIKTMDKSKANGQS